MNAPFAPTVAGSRSFTLVEMLVSVVILALLMALLAQANRVISLTWLSGMARIDNYAQARSILDLFDRDLQSIVLTPGLGAFVDAGGQPACAFYAQVPGIGGDTRRLSLVRYAFDTSTNPPALTRHDTGMGYGGGASPAFGAIGLPVATLAESQVLAPGVVGFQWQARSGLGALTNVFYRDYANPGNVTNTRSIVVSLLVLDTATAALVQKTGALGALTNAFAGAPSGSYAAYWNAVLTNGASIGGLPAPVRAGIRVFERAIALPVAPSS